jgi:hypothetical protein
MHCAPKPAWRPFLWRNNRCFGFQSIIYYYHPVVTLANFNFFILKLHQRNVYNLHLLLFLTSEGKDVNKCIVVDNDSLNDNLSEIFFFTVISGKTKPIDRKWVCRLNENSMYMVYLRLYIAITPCQASTSVANQNANVVCISGDYANACHRNIILYYKFEIIKYFTIYRLNQLISILSIK